MSDILPTTVLSDAEIAQVTEIWSNLWGLPQSDFLVCRIGYPVFLKPELTVDVFRDRLRIAVSDRQKGPSLLALNHPAWWIPSIWRQPTADESIDLYVIRMWETLRRAGYYDPRLNYVVSPPSTIGIDLTNTPHQKRVIRWLDNGQDEELNNLVVPLPTEYANKTGLATAQRHAETLWCDYAPSLEPDGPEPSPPFNGHNIR